MLKLLRSLVSPNPSGNTQRQPSQAPPITRITAAGAGDFNVLASFIDANGLPVLDWGAVHAWVDTIPDPAERASAWASCEVAWLGHLAAALGPHYRMSQKGQVLLVSSLDGRMAGATITFVEKTLQRVLRVLDGIGQQPAWGHDILIAFDDDETYYRYLAHYYTEAGEFAGSGGVFISKGCGHFATIKDDLRSVEPVIAHELTHSCLSHLNIPAWLNEGLAVNTERRLCPPPGDVFGHRLSPRQMHLRHQRFWGTTEIQEFWSGKSFLRADEGNELSYDLARILVAQLAGDWQCFRSFVLAADAGDSGNAAALAHLGMGLADAAAALLEQPADACWAPDPSRWRGDPERGAF